jgi:peptidyl-prolyl cis-trans isomerase SurA
MRRRLPIAICLAAWLAASAAAEIVDRIAVSVGSKVITETDLDREIRITALLNNEKPDFSPANKRKSAERMVDQMLVRGELEASRYPPPSAADVEAALQEEKARFGNDAAYRRALAEYGVDEDDLKARLRWQLMLVSFIDVRFRPGIQIGDEEIRKYFDDHMRAGLMQAHPGQTPSLDEDRAGIEQTLISQAADQQGEQWLKEARRRTRIQYHDEVFR